MNRAETRPVTATRHSDADRSRVRSDAEIAGSIISRSWPLETFIAVNPLGALEEKPFDEAIREAGRTLGARGTMSEEWFRNEFRDGRISDRDLRWSLGRHLGQTLAGPPLPVGDERFSREALLLTDLLVSSPGDQPFRTALSISESLSPVVAARVDEESAKWCAAFLGANSVSWKFPGREKGFYEAWRELASRDRSLPAGVREGIGQLPGLPEDALLDGLDLLGVPAHAHGESSKSPIAAMPGWAAPIRWLAERDAGIDLLAYLAMRVSTESLLLVAEGISLPAPYPGNLNASANGTRPEGGRAVEVVDALGAMPKAGREELEAIETLLSELPVTQRPLVWLDAYEEHYRGRLLEEIAGPLTKRESRPEAQLICCIDVRSEGLRRHFESLGNYETLGFAGFFAVAIRFQDLAGNQPTDLCPVLIEPRNRVSESPLPGSEAEAHRRLTGENSVASARDGIHAAEGNLSSPFALAEMSGWIKGPVAATRTLAVGRFASVRQRLSRKAIPAAPTVIEVENAFPLEERLLFAEVALTTMGLTGDFARTVILCGHGSTTENNPYESPLNCGACGGNRGAPNARTAAAILNGRELRQELTGRGIEIPGDTVFVAAEHDTATDRVEILDRHLVPESHLEELDRIVADLEQASSGLSLERSRSLPGAPGGLTPDQASEFVYERSQDWAEVFPEWGLAGNAAFIIGPRSMTSELDLERRAFLHSYDAEVDASGEGLETILTAPVIVAQWISCQYYFSAVDPLVFGSGTKVTHNVIGNVGVLSGHGGDLQIGLPWQSIADGDRLIHEPMRLLVVIQAPLDRIEGIIERNPVLRDLFGNGWLALAAREGPGDQWMRREPDGQRTSWTENGGN